MLIGIDCTGSCKSNYHIITNTTSVGCHVIKLESDNQPCFSSRSSGCTILFPFLIMLYVVEPALILNIICMKYLSMEFTIHNSFVILQLVPSSDFLDRAQLLMQKLLKQGYVAPMLKSSLPQALVARTYPPPFFVVSPSTSTCVLIMIWLTITKYPHLK